MRVLILVLAVCLAHLGLVQTQPVICSSNQPGTNCTTSNSCVVEHPQVGTNRGDYIQTTCAPEPYSMPISSNTLPCVDNEYCEITHNTDESTWLEGPPSVMVRLETKNVTQFTAHISWEHSKLSYQRRKGYQVQVFKDGMIQCFCMNNSDARNLSITGAKLMFGHSGELKVEVAPYPLPLSGSAQREITGQYRLGWPSSCLDLGTHNCYPPTYPAPSNIQLHTSIYNTSEGVETRRLDIQWDAVTPYSSWNNTRDRLTYYIQLERQHHEQPEYFEVNSVGNSTKVSVSLYPLNNSVNYTHIRVLTHYPCTGLATELTGGCGDLSLNYTTPPPGLQVSPTATSVHVSSHYHTVTSLPLRHTTAVNVFISPSNIPSTDGPTEADPVAVFVCLAGILIIVLVLISLAILVLMIFKFREHKKICERKKNVPPFVIVSINNIILSKEDCKPLKPPPYPSSNVFVFFCPESQNKEFILSNVVQRLTLTGNIDVSFPCETGRDVIPQWIEERVNEAAAVFIVCDESFCNDWGRETCPYVNALKLMFYSKISISDPRKFAVVVLNDEDQFIPTDYLKTLKKFTIREDCDDGREQMIHFARNTSPYELAPIESAESIYFQ